MLQLWLFCDLQLWGCRNAVFFTCTCTKYHQLLLQDSTAVRVVWENPEPFSVLVVQGLKLELLLLIT